MTRHLLKNRTFWYIAAAVAVGLFLLAWASWQNRYTINPDGVAYISIAEHYVNSDVILRTALNAYWSPLLSWLMVPFLWMGLNGQEAFAVINFLTGAFILIFGSWLCWRYTAKWYVVILYFLCALPFLLALMTAQITPDVLVVAWVLGASACFVAAGNHLRPGGTYKNFIYWALLLAFVGFVGYITKLYLQPVFIAGIVLFFFVFLAMHYRHAPSKKQHIQRSVTFLLLTGGFYFAFCLLWAIPISLKYETPTLGSSYAFNGKVGLHKPQTYSLIAPTHDYAITGWEDPTYLTEPSSTDTAKKKDDHPLFQRIAKIYNGFPRYVANVSSLWVFLFVSLIGAWVWLMTRVRFAKYETTLIYTLLAFGAYFGVYILHGGPGTARYQWPLLIMSILLTALLSEKLWEYLSTRTLAKWPRMSACVLLALFPLSLFLHYAQYPHEYLSPATPPPLQQVAEDLQKEDLIPERSNIAASDFETSAHMAYYLNARGYGTIPQNTKNLSKATYQQLTLHDIRYFIDITSPSEKKKYGKNADVVYSKELKDYCAARCQVNVVEMRY